MEFKIQQTSIINISNLYTNDQISHFRAQPLYNMILQYGQHPEIMHSIFYGCHRSGKYFYILSLLSAYFNVPFVSMCKKQKVEAIVKNNTYYIYKTHYYFEINVSHFLPYSTNVILDIIVELSANKNIMMNKYNIIIIRDFDILHHYLQQQLRRIMEMIYPSCRLFFTTNNLSRIDATIISRCYCIRIPFVCAPFANQDILPINTTYFTYSDKLLTIFLNNNLQLELNDCINSFKMILRNLIVKNIDLESLFIHMILLLPKYKVKNHHFLMIVQTINHFLYIYNIGYRKEYAIESLFVTIWNIFQQPSFQFLNSLEYQWILWYK